MDIKGINVSGPIRPHTTEDTYPVAYDTEIAGGLHTVLTLHDMTHIPPQRRKVGMLCSVAENNTLYKLINNPLTTLETRMTDWQILGMLGGVAMTEATDDEIDGIFST